MSADMGDAHFVAGSSGIFVLALADGDVPKTARKLIALARVTRSRLADHLTWVPFVDSFVVTAQAGSDHAEATVVPIDMLLEIICEGPPTVDRATLDRIARMVETGDTLPIWSGDLRIDDDSMGECTPSVPRVMSESPFTNSAERVPRFSSPTPRDSTDSFGSHWPAA